MIDLHTHTFASDGVLLPSELIRRAIAAGYQAIGLTDHADETNMEDLIARAVKAAEVWRGRGEIHVIPGVEITHVCPDRIAPLAAKAKGLGAKIVVVHGETITEPVAAGTNAAAVACPEVDILAHPGLITEADAKAAADNSVFLEITTRKGHSAANGHVASVALRSGAALLINTDAHAPGDLMDAEWARTVLAAAGLHAEEAKRAVKNAQNFLDKILG